MKKVIHLTAGVGGEAVFVKKISSEEGVLHGKVISLNKDFGDINLNLKSFFDEKVITPNSLKKIKKNIVNCEIVFFHFLYNYSSIILFLYIKIICRKKIIGIFHSYLDGGPSKFVRNFFYITRKFFVINFSILFLNKLIFLTNNQKNNFSKYNIFFKKIIKKSEIINNFIDEKDIIRKKQKSEFNILFVGRLSKFKGFFDLVYLSKKINEKVNIIGSGKYDKDIIPRNMNIIGYINKEDMNKYYDNNLIFILPSYTEVFPLSILEAMARGLVILVSDVCGMREIIKEGRNGFLFLPGDINRMKEIILYLKNNPKEIKRISNNNLEDIWKFNKKKQIKKYIKVYNEVLNENNKKQLH